MTTRNARREALKGGLAMAGLSTLGALEWALPALAQGETLVSFTDMPENFKTTSGPERRIIDTRTIDGPITAADSFFTVQHYGHPAIDRASHRLTLTGLLERPASFSVAELRQLGGADLVAGFECSGNRAPLQGLCSNGRWTGVPLRVLLERAGLRPEAREIVFFGADRGAEEVDFRGQKFPVEQQYGRSLPRDIALAPEPFLAYALNGEPLSLHQGSPLRLIVPGWYGVANVKWLTNVHAQADQFLGKYQARWYRTLRGELIDGELRFKEAAVTRMQLKSFVARVTREGDRCNVLGIVLNDGTPLRSVEVKADDGPWQPATLDPATSEKYSWKIFRYVWEGVAAGEHTLVSRVTDANGQLQPTEQELESKKTFLEHNAQFPRTLTIA